MCAADIQKSNGSVCKVSGEITVFFKTKTKVWSDGNGTCGTIRGNLCMVKWEIML